MPWGLKRYQNTGDLHFITFSCYHRQPFLSTSRARRLFEETLEQVRCWYAVDIKGYVVMPEHVHLLLSEPERSSLRVVIQMLKQITAQKVEPKCRMPLDKDVCGRFDTMTSMSGRGRNKSRSYGICTAIP